jgi:hypothetical protein
MEEDADRLRMVDGGLGGRDEQPDLVRPHVAVTKRARRSVGTERDRVLPRRHHRHGLGAQTDVDLLHRHAARFG